MSKFKTMPGDLEIVRGGTLLEKANPYRDASTGRFTTGGGGGGAPISEGDLLLKHFEKKVDKVYKTGTEDEFNIAHTGDQSTAALGQYLGKGSEINDNLRTSKTMAEAGYLDRGDGQSYTESDTVKGLDNAIEMAPPIGKQLVWRTTSADAIKGLKEGGVYMDKGYTSTTAADITHPDNGILLLSLATVTNGKKSIMEIETSKGKGLYMPRMFPGQPIAEHEKEFLMPRNTKMRYRGPEYRFLAKDQIVEIHRFKVVDE
jgi:hypothetical protein